MTDRTRALTREEPAILIASALLLIAALLFAKSDFGSWPELRIGIGFFLFFVGPGLCFMLFFFPHSRFHLFERYPLAIALSLGVWAFPGLLAYSYQWSLYRVTILEFAIIALLFLLALSRNLFSPPLRDPDPREPVGPGTYPVIALITLGLAVFAVWTGALRGPGLDWDHFNYISAVRKLLAWDHASIAHFAYRDAPPDPIHSYNIWALQWAVIGKLYRLDPIDLYVRSAFLTIPAAGLAFFSLGRRLFNASVARTAFFLFVSYHVIYGGLCILGMSTFYPDDSQWLITFPACLSLFLAALEAPGPGCSSRFGLVLGLSLAALGVSIIHVLWGLAFYLTLGSYALLLALYQQGAGRAILGSFRGGKAAAMAAVLAWALVPAGLMIADVIAMNKNQNYDGRTPLLGEWAAVSPWLYFLIFVALPAIAIGVLVLAFRPRQPRQDSAALLSPILKTLFIMAVCLLIAVPYIILRHRATAVTNWSQFGINPYRAFISSTWFFLNPYQRSLSDPTMTFYPLYLLGYLALPFLFLAGRKDPAPRLALAALIAVPLICFHPALATLFAKFFTLGYLRRLLKLAALFSLFPLALALHRGVGLVFSEDRRPLSHLASCLILAALLALAGVSFQAEPPYFNHLLRKTITTARTIGKSTLTYDAEPFEIIAHAGWFKPDDVIFADLWTSYRLTAYLPQFVAVQQKPGTGVPDQQQRRLLELEFFDTRADLPRMKQILDHTHAAGVILNRNPRYVLYNLPMSHPSAIGQLNSEPARFQLLYDQGDWVIFRYTPE